jgi:hypothetical protein
LELIHASFRIYNSILHKGIPTTIVCGGQSPSYYCLAMLNFSIYNPDLVDIVILPHSKHGIISTDQNEENKLYCTRLIENNIQLKENIVIIDGVHSGVGVNALKSALRYCFRDIKSVYIIAINAQEGVAKIPVDEEIVVPCEPKFSDVFPRLVESYYPRDFNDPSKFINTFKNLDTNPIAQMIIDIAKNFPTIQVEDTEWYKLNNVETPEILEEKRQKELQIKLELEREHTFVPIILENPKRFQCPVCNFITGTQAVLEPSNKSLFKHYYNCINKFKSVAI